MKNVSYQNKYSFENIRSIISKIISNMTTILFEKIMINNVFM